MEPVPGIGEQPAQQALHTTSTDNYVTQMMWYANLAKHQNVSLARFVLELVLKVQPAHQAALALKQELESFS